MCKITEFAFRGKIHRDLVCPVMNDSPAPPPASLKIIWHLEALPTSYAYCTFACQRPLPPPPNPEAPMQVNPDPEEKSASLLLKQSGRAPSQKRCPLFGPEETQPCCIFIEHPLVWPFPFGENAAVKTLQRPRTRSERGGSCRWGVYL